MCIHVIMHERDNPRACMLWTETLLTKLFYSRYLLVSRVFSAYPVLIVTTGGYGRLWAACKCSIHHKTMQG